MNTTQKVLIEQALYGISNDKINGEEFLIEAIDTYVDNDSPAYTLTDVLTESIQTSDTLGKYIPLLEAADEIKKYQKEISEAEEDVNDTDDERKVGAFNKLVDKVKDLVNWWYKVDPDTKAKTFRTIGRITLWVASQSIKAYARWKLTGRFLFWGKSNKPVDDVKGIKKFAPSRLIKRINWKYVAIETLVDSCAALISKLDHEIYYRINQADVEEMIDKYDKAIDDLNDMISETDDEELLQNLKKAKAKYTDAIRDLIRIRNEKNQREAKKKEKENN